MIDTYKTAKIPSGTSRAVHIIKTVYYIHSAEVIFQITEDHC